MELLPYIIGAVTNDFLTNEANSNFLNFAKFIDKPDDYYIYLNVVDKTPILNIVITDENIVSIPLGVLYENCPEFVNYYNTASFDGIYNIEALTAFAIYFILKDYFDKEDGSDEKESMAKLARLAAKFMKFGNLKLDKLLSNLRKPEKSPEEKLKDFVAKHTDKLSESQATEKSRTLNNRSNNEKIIWIWRLPFWRHVSLAA